MGRPVAPGAIAIPNTLMIKILWGDPGASAVVRFTNVLYGTYTALPSDLAGLATTLFTGFKNVFTSSGFEGMVHPTSAMLGVEVKNIGSANLPWFISTGAALAGTDTGAALPAQVAIAVTTLTARAGREWHGRIYFGGLGATAQSNARQHSTVAGTNAIAFATGFRTTMQASQITMALAQKQLLAGTTSSGAPLPPRTAHAEPITGFRITSDRFDTQRRRLGR